MIPTETWTEEPQMKGDGFRILIANYSLVVPSPRAGMSGGDIFVCGDVLSWNTIPSRSLKPEAWMARCQPPGPNLSSDWRDAQIAWKWDCALIGNGDEGVRASARY